MKDLLEQLHEAHDEAESLPEHPGWLALRDDKGNIVRPRACCGDYYPENDDAPR